MELGHEEYKVREGGIYGGFLFDRTQLEGEDFYRTTFYSGVRLDGTVDDGMLAALVVTKNLTDQISDQQITNAFIDSLAHKMRLSVLRGNEDYVKSFLTLPKDFFTEENCEAIFEPFVKEFLRSSPEQVERCDKACKQLSDYANHVNPARTKF